MESNISKTTSTNFTVTLSWEQDIGTHFTVHVVPDADLHFTKSTEVQLTMSYDVSHTVTIVGTRCGQNISRVVKEIFMSSSGESMKMNYKTRSFIKLRSQHNCNYKFLIQVTLQ